VIIMQESYKFQSAPRLVSGANLDKPNRFIILGVSIRAPPCERGEHNYWMTMLTEQVFQSAPRLVSGANRSTTCLGKDQTKFQSAPRLVSGANAILGSRRDQ